MPGEIVCGSEAAAAFALEFEDAQAAGAAGDEKAGFVGLEDFAGRAGAGGFDFGAPDFQQLRRRRGGKVGEGAGPRGEGPEAVP